MCPVIYNPALNLLFLIRISSNSNKGLPHLFRALKTNNLDMRKLLPFTILPALILMLGSYNDPAMHSAYKPIFLLRSEMESNIRLTEAQTILDPGKIYLKDHLIFINEKYKGIHVIDNLNPENP